MHRSKTQPHCHRPRNRVSSMPCRTNMWRHLTPHQRVFLHRTPSPLPWQKLMPRPLRKGVWLSILMTVSRTTHHHLVLHSTNHHKTFPPNRVFIVILCIGFFNNWLGCNSVLFLLLTPFSFLKDAHSPRSSLRARGE